MTHTFATTFFEKTHFPKAAVLFLSSLIEQHLTSLCELSRQYRDAAYDHQAIAPLVEELAERFGYSPYSMWLCVILLASEEAMQRYRSEEHFWCTMQDLRYKAQECFDLHGVWGTFVPFWYARFLKGTIVQLGRMQYDCQPWYGGEPVVCGDHVIQPGEPCIHLHIPSGGEPFDRAARLDSYRQAVAYFGKPLLCVCNSWLFYPPYEAVFAPTSNIADFRREFQIVSVQNMESCTLWNVIGPTYKQAPTNWPEGTSLQRAFKTYALQNGTFGTAIGVLYFDGDFHA